MEEQRGEGIRWRKIGREERKKEKKRKGRSGRKRGKNTVEGDVEEARDKERG